MAATKIASSLVKSSVNNGRRQPLQGFDTVVYFQDQATGIVIPCGEFTGFQHTVRNATEPYLPLGSRSLTLLDGEFQIGWVAEQGKVNLEAMQHIVGFSYLGPVVRIGRSPRFQVVVEYNAQELDESSGVPGYAGNYDIISDTLLNSTSADQDGKAPSTNITTRAAAGRYVFTMCKVDAFTSGVMAGRSVIADRIEGLAEGWYWEPFNKDIKASFSKSTLAPSGTRDYDKTTGAFKTDTIPKFDNRGKIPEWAVKSN